MVDDQGCSCTYHVNLILLTCVLCFVPISCTLYLLYHLPQLKHIIATPVLDLPLVIHIDTTRSAL